MRGGHGDLPLLSLVRVGITKNKRAPPPPPRGMAKCPRTQVSPVFSERPGEEDPVENAPWGLLVLSDNLEVRVGIGHTNAWRPCAPCPDDSMGTALFFVKILHVSVIHIHSKELSWAACPSGHSHWVSRKCHERSLCGLNANLLPGEWAP